MSGRAIGWFREVGRPPGAQAQAALDALVARIPAFAKPGVENVRSAAEALRVLRLVDADGTWWDFEETAREALWHAAAERAGEDALLAALARADDAVRETLDAAAWPAAIADDATLAAAAREAARLVAHQAALVAAAHAQAHWLDAKHALFDAGHWLLGGQGGRLFVF